MSTFAELKTQLQSLGYGTDGDTIQGIWINEAYRRVARRRSWSWLRATASKVLIPGTRSYTWSDFAISNAPRRLESLRLVDTTVFPVEVWSLDYLDPKQMDDIQGNLAAAVATSERELPRWWTRVANTGISLWAPPDLAYTAYLAYSASVTPLSAGGDTPIFNRDYHDVLVYEAAYQAAERQRDTVALEQFRAERDLVLSEMEADDSVAQLQSYEKIDGPDWNAMNWRG